MQWYIILLEKGDSHTSDDPSTPPLLRLIPQLHSSSPESLVGHITEIMLFKIVQSLLPTMEILVRLGEVQSPACTFCEAAEDNTAHLLSCP